MKTKRKTIRKQHKTKSRKYVLTKRNNKKRNYLTKKRREVVLDKKSQMVLA
jgi:hypothetical protein